MSLEARQPGRSRLMWAVLMLATSLSLIMGGLLIFELNQREALLARQQERVDSIAAPAFLLDRTYLRFVNALSEWGLQSPHPPLQAPKLQLDILYSKVAVLRDAPRAHLLLTQSEPAQTLAQLDALMAEADALFQTPPITDETLQALLQRLKDFIPAVQNLGNRADSLSSHLMETQSLALLRQNTQIIGLTIAQLLLLMAAVAGLAWRHCNQQREQQALQALNHQLREAKVQAERANRGKSVFLANMSHELRTPFNGIMGWLDIMGQSPLNAEQREWVATIRRSADHLLQLLNDILDMSALDAGKITLRPQPTDVVGVLGDVHQLMQPLAQAKGLDLTLQIDVPPQLCLSVDPTRLRQILINLSNNAIKFTTEGSVRLRAHVSTASDEGPQRLLIDVSDTGMGIAEHDIAHLFQRFHQVHDDLNRRYGGAGLGLQISQLLAELMGGDLLVQSSLGHGSTFTLRLPMTLASSPASAHQTTAGTAPAPSGLRVLLAEDNVVNQQFMRAVLARLNCEVTLCEDGAKALAAARDGDFDLVLMDIHMPEMDGLAATRGIRQLPGARGKVPIWAVTADVFEETRREALAAGVNTILTKPLRLATLREALSKWPQCPAPEVKPPA